MQLMTTSGPQALMPACVFDTTSDGSLNLSSVHQPASELSFYSDIFNIGRDFCATLLTPKASSLLALHEMTTEKAYVFSADQVVTLAKQVTGLSIKDLAAVFEVTRQTLYNFRKFEDRIAERNWARLEAVNDVIKMLSDILPMSPGSLCKHYVYEGQTLYSLLCEKELNPSKIKNLAESLATHKSLAVRDQQYHQTSIDQLTRHG